MNRSWWGLALLALGCGSPGAEDAGVDARVGVDAAPADASGDASRLDGGPGLVRDTSYQADPDPDLANPERGIYYWSPRADDPHTLVGEWLYLGDECDADLAWAGASDPSTSPVLRDYAARLDEHLAAGRKVIFRPRYDVPGDDEVGRCGVFHADTRARQLAHVDAVAAMLGDYRDVIAFVEAGYLGRWGEWNHAGYDASAAPLLVDPTSRREVAARALDRYRAAGLERHVELRRPIFAREVLAEHPESAGGIGLYDDCFMTNDSDMGTYSNFESGNPHNFASTAEAIAWAESHTLDASFGGETCPFAGARWERCDNMVGDGSEPARLHLSYLHGAWADTARATWEAGGCYDEIKRRLGYRFEVRAVSFPAEVASGALAEVGVEIENTGWARMHGARRAYLTITDDAGETRVIADAPVAGLPSSPPSEPPTGDAVAGWAPGNTSMLRARFAPPDGEWTLGVLLPDPDAPDALAYAVRLATLRDGAPLFDAATGVNDLGVVLAVAP